MNVKRGVISKRRCLQGLREKNQNGAYKSPRLKKYGSIKNLTHGASPLLPDGYLSQPS